MARCVCTVGFCQVDDKRIVTYNDNDGCQQEVLLATESSDFTFLIDEQHAITLNTRN